MRLVGVFCTLLIIAGCGDSGQSKDQVLFTVDQPSQLLQNAKTSVMAHVAGGFSYEKNTFINYWSCLGVYPGTSLSLGEKVWMFSKGQTPVLGEVVHVISAVEAQKKLDEIGFDKAYKDKSIWAEIGCAHSFRGDMPESLARMTPEQDDSGILGVAIRGLPADAWIAEGMGNSVATSIKDNPYVEVVQPLVTEACYGPDSLVRMKKFSGGNGHMIIQLDIGKAKEASAEQRKQHIEEELQQYESIVSKERWPKYRKEKMAELEKIVQFESVEICRFFLDDKRVLNAEKISRRTGAEERVETAPDLNADNWASTTDSAIGFISLNQGKDWDGIFVDVGWEGIGYSIKRLHGSTELFNYTLYTYH